MSHTNLKEFFAAFPDFFRDYVLEPLTQIKIIDVIDILLLTFFLFYLYRFIRNRRAGKLALGLLLLLFVLVMTNFLEMRAVGFLLQNFYQVGIIAIMIIFQPELRAALEKVGNNSIVTGIKNITTGEKKQYLSQLDKAAGAICDAVADMSEHKVGALIVIERDTRLGEYSDTGVTINAELSADLLKNIFFKNAPLHDGAVIIRNLRVQAAGCFLRISEREGLDSELGTRHRAALGVSEVSDAIVVVVSEETGKISLVHDSEIKRNYDRDSLKTELIRVMSVTSVVGKHKSEKEAVKSDE